MIPQIGQAAPEFSLFNTEKNKISLSDYRGKNVVLLFFPLAFSGVCTKELCSMRDDIATYSGLNAEILGISVDSLFALGRFKAENQLPFELLSDFNKEVCAAYGALAETFAFEKRGVGKRSAFVIDREGVIRYAEVLDNPGDLPSFENIQETLKTLN